MKKIYMVGDGYSIHLVTEHISEILPYLDTLETSKYKMKFIFQSDWVDNVDKFKKNLKQVGQLKKPSIIKNKLHLVPND